MFNRYIHWIKRWGGNKYSYRGKLETLQPSGQDITTLVNGMEKIMTALLHIEKSLVDHISSHIYIQSFQDAYTVIYAVS